jgi:hypothetical protein
VKRTVNVAQVAHIDSKVLRSIGLAERIEDRPNEFPWGVQETAAWFPERPEPGIVLGLANDPDVVPIKASKTATMRATGRPHL